MFFRSWRRIVVLIVVLAALAGLLAGAGGCRTNPQVALLELENRLLEDRIYELEAQLAKQSRELASCQSQTQIPPKSAYPPGTSPPAGSATPSQESPVTPGPGPYAPPEQGKPGGSPSGSGLPSLNIQMPKEALPPGQLPPRFLPSSQEPPPPPSGSGGPELNTPEAFRSLPPRGASTLSQVSGVSSPNAGGRPTYVDKNPVQLVSSKGWPLGAVSSQVQAIRLLPEITGPYNPDGLPGDEGIIVGIEPVDGQGRFLPAAAPISIVVIDPAIPDESARVARWDFTAEQIAAFTQTLPEGEQLRLPLLWPHQTPRHNRLHLFVRYLTADGRKLQADMPIMVDVQGRQMPLLADRPPTRYFPNRSSSQTPQIPGSNSPGSLPSVSSQEPETSAGGMASAGVGSLKTPARPESFGAESDPSPVGRPRRIPWSPNR